MTETETKSEAHAGVIRTWCRDPMLMAALITVIANVVIAIGANQILDRSGFSSAEQATGSSVRLGE